MSKVIAITQARTGSTRLPNKVLLEIKGKTLIEIHIERIKKAKLIDDIFIATTDNPSDNIFEKLSNKMEVKWCWGSENDVLDRFYQAVKETEAKWVVRLTSDCPLIDPKLIDEVILEAKRHDVDYYSNAIEERYPDGQDIEVIKFSALKKAWEKASLASDREHVTPYICKNSSHKGGTLFKSKNHDLSQNYTHVRLTVDEPRDFQVIKQIVLDLGADKDWETYTKHYLNTPEIGDINKHIVRNEGYLKSLLKDVN